MKLFFSVENVIIPAAPVATDQRRRCALVTLPGPRQEGAAHGSCWPSFKLAKRSGCALVTLPGPRQEGAAHGSCWPSFKLAKRSGCDPQGRPRRGVESA